MDDIMGLGRRKPDGHAARIKDLVRQRLDLPADTTLMVSELRCHEDGCPDVETVVAVLAGAGTQRTWKIAKPMAEVSAGDLVGLA